MFPIFVILIVMMLWFQPLKLFADNIQFKETLESLSSTFILVGSFCLLYTLTLFIVCLRLLINAKGHLIQRIEQASEQYTEALFSLTSVFPGCIFRFLIWKTALDEIQQELRSGK
jgi:uncharacterized membrane protein YdjX (TVP38/TMEM64 family)